MLRYALGASGAVSIVFVSIALGSTGGTRAAVARSQIAIVELGSTTLTADQTFKGRFTLALDGVVKDSGSTVIRPNQGVLKIVGGQQQVAVFGTDTLTSKNGTLSLSFRGVSITVHNIDRTKGSFDNEHGTWQINGNSGTYKGWKGGGGWAVVATPSANNIEWDGYVTHG
jgi:hypothetical protein